MYSFYRQINFLTLSLISYFKTTTGRKKEHTLIHSHTKFHISNNFHFQSLFSLYFKQLYSRVKSLFFCIYHKVSPNLNVNIITPSDHKTTDGRREKAWRRRDTQTKEEEKRGCLINSSFFFYIVNNFLFSISTHPKLFLYVC